MTHAEALELLRAGVPAAGGVWADLGAGGGTFTRALAELLGPEGVVVAVDRRPDVAGLAAPATGARGRVIARRADIARRLDLPRIDGILMANVLHFVRSKEGTLRNVLAHLLPGGTVLLIEYDLESGNPWVPCPLSLAAWRELAPRVGLSPPRLLARRPSRFGHGELYLARSSHLVGR